MKDKQPLFPCIRACSVADIMRDIRDTGIELRGICGIDAPTALTKAICLAEQAYGIDMTAIKPVVLRGVPECPPKGDNEWQISCSKSSDG